MIVRPLIASSFSSSITLVAVNASSPVVGSSRKMRFGSVISSTPIEVRLRSPPETPLHSQGGTKINSPDQRTANLGLRALGKTKLIDNLLHTAKLEVFVARQSQLCSKREHL